MQGCAIASVLAATLLVSGLTSEGERPSAPVGSPHVRLVGERPSGPADFSFAPKVAASKAASESWTPAAGVTLEMKAAADSTLLRLVGRKLFLEWLVFDPLETDDVAPRMARRGLAYRRLSYWFVVPGDTGVACRVSVLVEPDGSIRSTWGVPDCETDPPQCVFIGREAAFASAAAAGLEPGLIPWRWLFYWDDEHGYYYEVRTILKREGHWDEGEVMRLSASDGAVLRRLPTKAYYKDVWSEDDTPN